MCGCNGKKGAVNAQQAGAKTLEPAKLLKSQGGEMELYGAGTKEQPFVYLAKDTDPQVAQQVVAEGKKGYAKVTPRLSVAYWVSKYKNIYSGLQAGTVWLIDERDASFHNTLFVPVRS